MFIADFHIHSKYSRATSKDCQPETLSLWARRKGLDLIGSGDFTHPAWRRELAEKLTPAEEGLYVLKDYYRLAEQGAGTSPRFIVTGEISSIYKKGGKVRKVHNLILLPSLEAAETLSRRLEIIGNLRSDGRPILGLDSRDLLEITLSACEQAIFIPAHIWTPHFSLFGAYSGFDDIRECFEDLTCHIHALETGLSSDPAMNWRLSALDDFTLVSNSDAHSPANLAREANLFATELSYPQIARALADRAGGGFYGTIEFFPEEGKYHYDGHRNCGLCQKPQTTVAAAGLCPVCGKPVTVGVLHRVEALADRAEGFKPANARHYESLVPLPEVIAAATGNSAISQKGRKIYADLLRELGPELFVLRQAELAAIEAVAGPLAAEGIRRLRGGKLEIYPGYDGAYGKVQIISKEERAQILGQLRLFNLAADAAVESGKQALAPKAHAAAAGQAAPAAARPGPEGASAASGGYALNPQQQQAACAEDPAIAVIAGPGTGKTRTLVGRALYLLKQDGLLPAQLTAVTFTNKAAREMRERLEQEIQDKRAARALNIGTFHAICLRLLSGTRQSAPTLLDEANALSLAGEVLRQLELKITPRQLLRAISLRKNGAPTANTELPEQAYELYQQQLAVFDALDYDDLLLKALAQAESGDLSKRQAQGFRHLLVDEFQDINPLQYRLIQAWSQHSAGLFVIGDPNQSIYSFRGADSACFEWFFADHPQARRVELRQNYRSTPQIISCSAALMEQSNTLTAGRADGKPVRLLTLPDAATEARIVSKEISRMVGGLDMLEAGAADSSGASRSFADIAVLYRTNRQALALERCLAVAGIPYVVAGREDFLTSPQVVDTLAFFRLLLNPDDALAQRRCAQAWGEHRLAELREKYLPQLRRAKPAKLLETWILDSAPDDLAPLELLLHMAVLHKDIPSLLFALTLGQEGDIQRSGGKKPALEAVSLLTLHGAKGLEFPVVFLCGLSEGLLPIAGRQGSVNVPEEKRLFYVGLTRAKDELILLAPGAPSPFLAELPRQQLSLEEIKAPATPEFQQTSLFGKN